MLFISKLTCFQSTHDTLSIHKLFPLQHKLRTIFDLSKYIDIPIRGFEPLLNLLLDETVQYICGKGYKLPCDTNLIAYSCPLSLEEEPLSFSSIPNTFLQQQEG
uniref:Uncharacterized protein n=1 Tax=Oncorhynchus kisutch TaxID=8019 RepID=A0A8C7EZW0_ONCKI